MVRKGSLLPPGWARKFPIGKSLLDQREQATLPDHETFSHSLQLIPESVSRNREWLA